MTTVKERVASLTTTDNPYNPVDQFDEWYAYDIEKGYGTLEYLARIANTSDSFPDEYNQKEIERAIDEICFYNINGMYKKVVQEVENEQM